MAPVLSRCFMLLLAAWPMTLLAEVRVSSPDGAITVTVATNERQEPFYTVSFNGEVVLSPSRLGLRFRDAHGLDSGFAIEDATTGSHDSDWEQPWGERRRVRDHHSALAVRFAATEGPARHFTVRFRVFDDGVGFRYEVPEQAAYGALEIVDELTEFHLPGDATAWWIPGRRYNRYEYLYRTTGLGDIETAHTPLTARLPSGVHLALHEAALVDYAAYVLDQRRDNVFQTNLTPGFDGVRVRTAVPFHTPWRTIHLAPDAVGLLNSDLVLNLNEPNRLGEVDWVEPGKYLGIWWSLHLGKHTWGAGPRHGATTERAIAYLDFAAEHGFDGVLVEGWNVGWDGEWFHNGDLFSFTEAYPDFDLAAVAAHGEKVGVRLVGHHETSGNVTNYMNQVEAAFALYERHGVRQVKTGYVADAGDVKRVGEDGVAHYEWHDGQTMVNHYNRLLPLAAKHRISINTHEPIKDTGLRRTWPNWLSREGARGQEYNAWGVPPNPPEHTAILPYTRMLAGPMDFTPGIFDLTFDGADSPQRVRTTLAKQLALYVVIYSPIQMAADLPENYAARPDAFRFIEDVPTDWEDSRALAGEVGDFVVFARQERGGEDWYLGAVTDEAPRTLEVPLDFLGAGAWTAQVYRDGPDAHWRDDPYDLLIESLTVAAGDTLTLALGAGGGAAVRFTPRADR